MPVVKDIEWCQIGINHREGIAMQRWIVLSVVVVLGTMGLHGTAFAQQDCPAGLLLCYTTECLPEDSDCLTQIDPTTGGFYCCCPDDKEDTRCGGCGCARSSVRATLGTGAVAASAIGIGWWLARRRARRRRGRVV
jgi:hypothetical protein